MFANVGLNGAGVFYNSLLPHMGEESEMDSISNKAFAAGYSWRRDSTCGSLGYC